MNWHWDQLRWALGIGGLFSLYGVVAVISVILDRKFGWGNQERLIILALVLISLPFALLITYLLLRKRKKSEADEGDTAPEPEAPVRKGSGDGYTSLREGLEEVVRFLKGSQSKEGVYELPWFIVAGPAGSGKSSLVLGSNLDFQTLPSQRQSEQRVLRRTQGVDWRVSTDAVFIDTSGRYQTEGSDADEWSALLGMIRAARPLRPIDGIILTVDVEKILGADERELEETAKLMRARLDEAHQQFKTKFPVYLVFTHADSIEGFRDSFSVSKKEARELVWGATFTFENAESGHALFDEEFERLLAAAMKRRMIRLSAPFAPVRQLRIFNFPLHFGAAKRRFGHFVSALFRPNPFTESPVFRGFYLTASPVSDKGSGQAGAPSEPYFVERWFRDVLLRDKDVARTFKANSARRPVLGWALTAVGALLTAGFLILSVVSLVSNKQFIDEAEKRANVVLTNIKADENVNLATKDAAAVRKEIDAIENLRAILSEFDEYEREGAPFYLGLGLYSGNRIYKEKLLTIYFNAVERRFKTPVVKKVESELAKFADGPAANPGRLSPQEEEMLSKNYDLLKAYLMLSKDYRAKANSGDVVAALKPYWRTEAKLTEDLDAIANLQLEFWAKQVDREEFPKVSIDEKRGFIPNARTKLKAFPPVFRYYKRKTTEISRQIEDTIGPMTVAGILSRKGGDTEPMQGSYTVPGAFTLEGYKLMRQAIDEAEKELGADDWVVGEEGRSQLTTATDVGRLEEKYFGDYTNHWRDFVKGVSVKKYTKETAKNSLTSFGGSDSPMRLVVTEIERNTNFSRTDDSGWFQFLWDALSGLFSQEINLDTGGNSQVEKEFRPLFEFVKPSGGRDAKVPFDEYRTEIELVAEKFRSFSPAKINEIAAMPEDARNKEFGQLSRSTSKIEGMLKSFRDTPSGQALAELLGQPLGALNELLGAGAKEQMAKKWSGEIAAAAKEVERGFPFEDGGSDADLAKLKDFLNPVDGKFSKFFEDNLKKDFEEANGTFKVAETSRFQYTDEFVTYLNAVMKLRTALFGKNPAPGFEYSFTLKPPDGATVEATVDGQQVRGDANSGSMNLKFPAPAGTESGVSVRTSASAPAAGGTAPEAATGGTSTSGGDVRKAGPWGLFRFVFEGSPKSQSPGEYLVTYTVGGKTVTALVKASGGDPFDRSIFKARAPQNIFK